MAERSGPMYYSNTSEARKGQPMHSGCLRYFPAALALVSVLSRKGNDKHNPGEPIHWSRDKSADHGDALVRHQKDVGTIDTDVDLDHAVEVAWRALAQLQELAERVYGWPVAPGARTSADVSGAGLETPWGTLPAGWAQDPEDTASNGYSPFFLSADQCERAYYSEYSKVWFAQARETVQSTWSHPWYSHPTLAGACGALRT